ncbi:MAG: UDP-N-acetylenolpyruvoylglucosamine reductase [Gammaproteobacteria bacterium RIFCSPHIGHO2_12_FULL_38_14]|nr:MAG: UDP-N-acetylenolpyruvoylglucosamine reductase [Gammaproteobacteria bacterium RIFCSPHIGHO2_12_FULL_38_14]
MIVQENKSLKLLNTFNLDYLARFYTEIENIAALKTILIDARFLFQPKLILGGGSNILLTQNFPGLVIHNKIKGVCVVDENKDHVFIQVGAGENWHQFVLYCINNNYAGIENLSLIPGTVGAAPIQNIGAYGVELQDVLHAVETMSLIERQIIHFSNQDCALGYRDSVFKNALKNQFVVTHVTLRLNKKPIFNIKYGAIQSTLEKMGIQNLSIKAISDAVIKIRQEKLPDPKQIGNAGSFFKNIIITKNKLLEIQKNFPAVPYFTETFLQKDQVKIPAAWLIEQAGFKGKRIGDIGVHQKQALVLVNHGNGSGLALKHLSEQIQQAVFRKFNIQLTPEVTII